MLLDFIGGIILTAIMVVTVNAVVSTLDVSRVAKLGVATGVGLWIGLQVSLATVGAFASDAGTAIPLIGPMLAIPLIIVGAVAAFSPSARAAMLALPQPLLIGLHAPRVLGVFFLLLAASGRMSGAFPQSAGWGDIITGVVAVPLAILAARRPAPTAVFWWNVFGAADLLIAGVLGLQAANPSSTGPGSDAVAHLPWALIPTVLVPIYLVLHGIVFAQLRATRIATRRFATV